MQVKDLKPAKYNPRNITDKKLDMLGKSMKEFGDLSGIIYNRKTGRLIGGHQRIKHLNPEWEIIKNDSDEGYIKTPFGNWTYREVEWDEKKEIAANIAANKHGGDFDIPTLKDLLVEIDDGAFDMELTGFEMPEIQAFFEHGQPAQPSNFKALSPFEIEDFVKKEIEKAERIIIQFSGGKDSSYTLLKVLPLLDKGKTEAVYVDTGAEYPDLMMHVLQFTTLAGIKLTVLKSPKNWHEIYGVKKKFPDVIFRDCIDPLINHPINKYGDTLGDNVLYIRGGMSNQKISRGARKGKTDVLQIIAGKYKILNPIYYINPAEMKEEIKDIMLWPGYAKGFQRTCCWTCPFQKVEHWEAMKKWYPMLWDRMQEMARTFEFK